MEKQKITRANSSSLRAKRRRKKRILRRIVIVTYYSLWVLFFALIIYFGSSFIRSHFFDSSDSISAESKIIMYKGNNNTLDTSPITHKSDSSTKAKLEENKDPALEQKITDDGKLIVCIDAGHGGNDKGCNTKKRNEKTDTLKVALEVKKYLSQKGVKVILTRSSDKYLSLEERVKIAKKNKCDYFVSIHRNCGAGSGFETWHYSTPTKEAESLSQNVHNNIVKYGVSKDRGVKGGTQEDPTTDYYVLRNTTMPSCLVELGFLNQYRDNLYFDEKYKDYAHAIGDAILDTYKQYHK